MPRQFTLPDLGEGLTEAEIVAVLVREGDVIREDAPLLEVETDKAQVEIPSPIGGRGETIHVTPGQHLQVGAGAGAFFPRARARPRRWTGGRDAGYPPARPRAGRGPRRSPGQRTGWPHPRRRRARDHGGPAAGGSA